MAHFKLYNENNEVVSEREYRIGGSHNVAWECAKLSGVWHQGILYKWKELSEAFQCDSPKTIHVDFYMDFSQIEADLRNIPGVLSVHRVHDSFVIECLEKNQGEVVYKAGHVSIARGARKRGPA